MNKTQDTAKQIIINTMSVTEYYHFDKDARQFAPYVIYAIATRN